MKNNEETAVIRCNFIIVRKMIKICRGNLPIGAVYTYLFEGDLKKSYSINDLKKYDAKVQTFTVNGMGNMGNFFERLVDYGISKEFFDGSEYICDDEVFLAYCEKLSDGDYRGYVKETIEEHVMDFKNLDGSRIIDCVRNLIYDLKNITRDNQIEIYEMLDQMADTNIEAFSQNVIRQFYNDSIKEFTISDLSEKKFDLKLEKATKKATTEQIRKNLLIIFEVYELMLCMNDADSDMENLYEYLGLNDEMVDSIRNNVAKVDLPCKEIAEKLAPYKFSGSLFRTERTTKISCSKELKEIVSEFYESDNKDIEYLHDKISVELAYKTDTSNLLLLLSVYSLYRAFNKE